MKLWLRALLIFAAGVGTAMSQSTDKPTSKKYHVVGDVLANWHKALHYCMTRGWRLATITSKEENDQIIKQIRDAGVYNHHWIAGTNIGNEPYFYWMGLDQPLTFADWHNGEPNNFHLNEDCLELKYWNDIFKWNDTTCRSKLNFVCEEILDD